MSTRREPSASPARGAVLVAVAVILGLVLIRSGLDTDGVVSAGDSDRRTTTTGEGTSTTAATIRPPNQVTVLVANGSGVDGAAGRASTTLTQKGYRAAQPTNAEEVTTTAVFYVDGYEAEAEAVAVALGASAAGVAAMPTPAPVANLGGAHVLVVLGPDLATPA